MNIIDLFSQNKLIQDWQAHVSQLERQLIMGLSGSSRALAIASAYQANKGKYVVITSTQNEVEKLASDLSSLIGEEQVYTFFADDVAAAEFIFSSIFEILITYRSTNLPRIFFWGQQVPHRENQRESVQPVPDFREALKEKQPLLRQRYP